MKIWKGVSIAVASLALAGTFALGGCSSDGKSVCEEFCDTACAKAQQCGVFADFGFASLDECKNYCNNTAIGDSTSDECRDNERDLSAQGCSWFDTRK